ncbi:complement C1q subcomponent subunit A [Clarias gariepinus]|uniref:complement C1q subcomponent subunit A n=1 Tax=Clarias gariepinus TaxID=13013 RepID=UPI00234E254C|nr:complement C1q subcomponent subunit A [Clarias gariepinus]
MKLSFHLFGVVWVAILLSISLCQETCTVPGGKPGVPGTSGSPGQKGQKGEKGQSGLQLELSKEDLVALKGEKGEQGPIGDIGAKGFDGLLGPLGPIGPPGSPGSTAGSRMSHAEKAAFTVVRNLNKYPTYSQPVIFNDERTNLNNDFSHTTGKFTCKVAGTYYFVFHSASEGDLCLKLVYKSNPEVGLTFCDYNKRTGPSPSQVMSGGVVTKLARGDEVWLQPVKIANKDTNKMSKTEMSVFSGFLIFPSG